MYKYPSARDLSQRWHQILAKAFAEIDGNKIGFSVYGLAVGTEFIGVVGFK